MERARIHNGRFLSILKDVLGFVSSRERSDGGFAATPRLPSTIEDTFHALAILAIAGRHGVEPDFSIERRKHLAFLQTKLADIRHSSAKTVYQLSFCISCLGVDRDDIANVIAGQLQRLAVRTTLEDVYYIFLSQRIACCSEAVITSRQIPRFPFRGIIEKRVMAIEVDAMLNRHDKDAGHVINWLMSCQNRDGGFGFMPGTTSFIENMFWAVKGLSLLNAMPKDIAGAIEYIYSCRTMAGGFARRAGAAPFLDATFHAVSSLYVMHRGLCHENIFCPM